jgi:hypothetical protein
VNYCYSENHRVSKIWRMPSSFKSLLASYEGAARYSGSYQYLNIVAWWLGNCSAHHKLCETDEKAGLLSRLINLGIKEDIQRRVIAVSAAVDEYAALSYSSRHNLLPDLH